jgi:hypothetical protein
MPSGFIQILASGNEKQFLHNNPQISFFHSIYRRYTNFFINTDEIIGNSYNKNNNLIFNIPNNGDLLSKSFIKINFPETYIEILNSGNIYNTFNTNILNLYDTFNVSVNDFLKSSIKNINLQSFKIKFILNNNTIFTILSKNFNQSIKDLLIYNDNIVLETDINNIYYNLNNYLHFYSFIYNSNSTFDNLLTNQLFNINFSKINYIIVDFIYNKTSFKLYNLNFEFIFKSLVSNLSDFFNTNIKINLTSLYIQFQNPNSFFSSYLLNLFSSSNLINITLHSNKINSKSFTSNNSIVNSLFVNKSSNPIFYVIYYNNNNNDNNNNDNNNNDNNDNNRSLIEIYNNKEEINFGNLDINDYNDCLIYSENSIINNLNVPNVMYIDLITYIRIMINIYGNLDINEYLSNINNKVTFINKRYMNDINIFYNKILDVLIDPKTIITNTNNILSMIFQNNINKKENILINNKKNNNFQDIIINKTLYKFIFDRINKEYNSPIDLTQMFIDDLYLINSINNSNSSFNLVDFYNELINSNYNNNLYEIKQIYDINKELTYNLIKNINNISRENIIDYIINYFNIIFTNLLITQSLTILPLIYNKKSNLIYDFDGKTKNINYVILPLSSNLFINNITNNVYFNTPELTYKNKIKNFIYNSFIYQYYKFNNKITFNLPINQEDFNQKLNPNSEFNILLFVENYYSKSQYYLNSIDINKFYLNYSNFNSYTLNIYNTPNIINFIFQNLFNIIDTVIFNKAFTNSNFNIDYTKFLFIFHSPYFRLFNIFIYLCQISNDTSLINNIPSDIIILRDQLLLFIVSYIEYYNNDFSFSDEIKQNYELKNFVYNINFSELDFDYNFIVYDSINIFNNLQNLDFSSNIFCIYSPFYFTKNNYNNYDKNQSIDDIFLNINSNSRINFDDNVVEKFIGFFNSNLSYYKNPNNIFKLISSFINKNNYDYNNIVNNIFNIFSDLSQYNNSNNLFYNIDILYNSNYSDIYYVLFNFGNLYDNFNKLLIDTINNIVNNITNYKNYTYLSNYFCPQYYDIKQYSNFIDKSQLSNGFKYFKFLFNYLVINYYISSYYYYSFYISGIQKYIIDNYNYLNNYITEDILFYKSINIIKSYISIFNKKNNSTVSFDIITNSKFIYNKYIIIFYLYYKFISECLFSDISYYIYEKKEFVQFDTYLLNKYSINIYIQCLEDIISLIDNNNYKIYLDFSSLNLYKFNIRLDNLDSINDINKIFVDNFSNINDSEFINEQPKQSIFDKIINDNDIIKIYDTKLNNISIKSSTYDGFIYDIYNFAIGNIYQQLSKFLFTIIDYSVINKDFISSNINNVSINNLFNIYKNSNYSIILDKQNTIYNNLYNVYYTNINNFNDKYKYRIINDCFNSLLLFKNVYSYNLYYNNFDPSFNNIIYINDILTQNIAKNNQNLKFINNIIEYSNDFFNFKILYSIIIEKEINRLLYYFTSLYVIKLIKNPSNINYLSNNSLYNIVKLFDNLNNPIYNTSLYQNEQITQLLNINNFNDTYSLLQNSVFLDLLSNINENPLDINSFFYYYQKFYLYIKNLNLINNLLLNNGVSVFDYFNDIANYPELYELIYSFLTNNDNFSPFNIYNNIIQFNKISNNNININLSINNDLIIKKLCIFSFMTYLIHSLMAVYIAENFFNNINFHNYLIYYLQNENINVNLNNVFDIEIQNIIKNIIYNLYKIDDNFTNLFNVNIDDDRIKKIIEIINSNIINLKNKYLFGDFVYNFIDSYHKMIKINDYISIINSIYNNDTNSNNSNNYFITINTFMDIDINYSIIINDLFDLHINESNIISVNNHNILSLYNKTIISKINLLYYFVINILKYYNITYSDLFNNVSDIITYFRISPCFMNDLEEKLKGLNSNYSILTDFINTNSSNESNINDFFTKISNINILSKMTINQNNNFSFITPNDYDYEPLFINQQLIFNNKTNLYIKYFDDYNFYKYSNNFISIYDTKDKYYQNIINKDYLTNIKNNNINYYNKIFKDIIYTKFANTYYKFIDDNNIFIETFKEIINLYYKYNFSFRLNENTSNITNLDNQIYLNSLFKNIKSLEDMKIFILELYNYEIFNDIIKNYNPISINSELNLLLTSITTKNNFYQEYYGYILNILYKLQLAFIFNIQNINYIINSNINNPNINYNNNSLDSIFNNIKLILCSPDRINDYFIYKYNELVKNNYNNPYIYDKIINSVNYQEFIILFSIAMQNLFYYKENIASFAYLFGLYNNLFANKKFFYKKYVQDIEITEFFILTFDDFTSYTYLCGRYLITYINNILFTNTNILDNSNLDINIFNELYEYLNNIFSVISNKNIFKNYDSNIDISNIPQSLLIYNLKLIDNPYWGLLIDNYDKIVNNSNIYNQISFNNYYYIYMTNIDNNIDINYDFSIIINKNNKLELLYIIYILLYHAININDKLIFTNINIILTKNNNYIDFGQKINVFDLNNDISYITEYINRNIINNNKIENYYKDIIDNSIKDIIYYNNKQNIFNYHVSDSIIIDIYNKITNDLGIKDENTIGKIYFLNTLINYLDDTTEIIADNNLFKNNNIIINDIFTLIITRINKKLDLHKKVLGGNITSTSNISITINQMINILSDPVYKLDDKIITIMTLIYNNFEYFKLESFNYEMFVSLLYYIILIIYLSYNTREKSDIYLLINIVNNKIIDYKNNSDFFNLLNSFINTKYNNLELSNKINSFFNNLINNKNFTTNIIDFNSNFNSLLINQILIYPRIFNYKNILVSIIEPNSSEIILYLKSTMNDNIYNINKLYINEISKITNGFVNSYGIIKMFDNIKLLFGDELIDTLNYDIYKIIIEYMTEYYKYNSIKNLIGANDNNIHNYDSAYIIKMKENSLYLPLYFFFDRRQNAIPLISALYTNIYIKLKLNNKFLLKDFYKYKFLSNNDIKTSLICDFVILEKDERKRLSINTIDNIIERHTIYELTKNINFINNNIDNIDNINLDINNNIRLMFDFDMINLVKELFWNIDLYINDYKINNELNNINSIYNYIISYVFYIDGVKREGITNKNMTNVYNILNKYKYNTRSYGKNIYNNYSFALTPEELQPSGVLNMSVIKKFSIELIIDGNKLINYITKINNISNLQKLSIKLSLFTFEYNIIRYQAGISGLLFNK